ncbi:hypothetical protein BDV06DRAFT_235631 [Aspergillus oleicola]
MIVQLIGTLALAYLGWSIVTLEINYRRAATMGIPCVRLIVDPQNLAWMMLESHVWRILDRLPIDWGTFGKYARRERHFADKASSHLRYGPAWALRRFDFQRPSKIYKVLDLYGPCISSASYEDWPRHRKVLASPFNEGIMTFVWNESVGQAHQMLHAWTGLSTKYIASVAKDTRTLSLNVLASTGFRKSYKFYSANYDTDSNGDATVTHSNEAQGYRDALQTVLDNCILLMVMPQRVLRLPFAPASWRHVARAAAAFKEYMAQMLDDEVGALDKDAAGSGGLMSSFVRAMEQKQEQSVSGEAARAPAGLTLDEIFGNIFVINFAGHDTTANTLAFIILLLAACPDVQDWVSEELRAILPVDGKGEYKEIFPKLKRCRAVMFETLRLYPPIMSIPKWTNEYPQSVKIGNRTIVIPPNTGVMPSILAIQTHPDIWPDPLTWNPSRWITSPTIAAAEASGGDGELATELEREVFYTPPRSTHLPWSDGPHNCPGSKFSQVECVAVLACLLRNHHISAVPSPGESCFEDTRARILATVDDVDQQILLIMKHADRVRLVCSRAD